MRLNLHKKAYKKVLLIANGHDAYYHDLSSIAEKKYFIDPYSQKKNHLASLKHFKTYLKENNIDKSSTKIIYASGLENKKEIKKYLDNEFIVCGNSFNKYDFLSDTSNINLSMDDNILLPKTSNKYLNKYIRKRHDSSGGVNVGNKISSKNIYYQQFIPGKTYSVSFITTKNKSHILGFNQLFIIKDNIEYPYLHAGAITLGLKNSNYQNFKKWINNISDTYNIKGYCSIDFKIYGNKVFILDINPRLSASYRMYTRKYNNLMKYHCDLTDVNLKINNYKYYSYIFLYAKNELQVDKSINNIKDISDRPQIGEIIKKNMPILTLNITSHNKDNLLKKIKNRIKSAMKIIDCYNIELEYE